MFVQKNKRLEKIGIEVFRQGIEDKLEKFRTTVFMESLYKIKQNESVVRKICNVNLETYEELVKGRRIFIKDYYMPAMGFITGFSNYNLTMVQGPVLAK